MIDCLQARKLRLWTQTLRAYIPDVEPEASHFADLIEWLQEKARAIEECPGFAEPDREAEAI